jgi:hypothetical protein
VRAPVHLPAQGVGLVVGQPHAGQVVGRQQLREDLGVDLVGLDLGLGDRARLGRIRDHHARHPSLQQPRDRVRVAGRLQRHLVLRPEAVGEQPQRLRRRRNPADLADHAGLPDRDLRELAMHIKPDAPARHRLTPSIDRRWESRRANDTYGSALEAQPGESQGRPSTNTGSKPSER